MLLYYFFSASKYKELKHEGFALYKSMLHAVVEEILDIKFLCLNGTIFDQETRVCERYYEVDCSQAELFYDLNLQLYQPAVQEKL